jgi:hypothetical protein
MRLRFLGPALGLALLLLTPPRSVAAQSLASLAAANSATSAVEKAGPGCWGCGIFGGWQICKGGMVPGYYNCIATVLDTCQTSSPGCGGMAAVPLDPDGSTQYVSRGSLLGVPVSVHDGDPPVRRNCEGVVVARLQTSGDITAVRIRTGSLTL